MATAYAAFTSLMHLTTQLHEHPKPPIQLDVEQFDSLSLKFRFFQRFLEDHHTTVDHELEIRIADVAHAAENLIETHIADRVVLDFYGSLQRLIECMDLIKEEVVETIRSNQPAPYHTPSHASSQSPSAASGDNNIVGIEDITVTIVDKLTSSQHKFNRQVISISGMGGIGKTTLARKVYDHPYIKNYFDFFAWTTISKDYNTRESLLEILHCLDRTQSKERLREKSEYELGEQMYKYLFGRRYLVVLDDVWDLEAWEKLRSYFPTDSGSGIVITSRESKFASISSHSIRMHLLDEHQSWDLFCKHVFGQDSCPVELENVGKKITKKCSGLPLSIVVIGSHLAKSPKKPEYWENIANNISSVDDDHCLKIVSLSYTHLPVHLRPCFLYMGIFPEDEEISISRLIKLWVAEGFVKPINGKSLEDAARDYLSDLVDRNLILSSQSSHKGRIERCKIHDLLRDFCLKEASKKNFSCTVHKSDGLRVLNNERRIAIHPRALQEASTTDSLSEKQELLNRHIDVGIALKARAPLRTLVFGGRLLSSENKLLRMLASFDEYSPGNRISLSHTLLTEVLHQNNNMRYLTCWISGYDEIYDLPSSISLLWNLQSLIIFDNTVKAPPEIWKMPQLRHITTRWLVLPQPPSDGITIMENLQTAGRIRNIGFSEDVIKRIPNIKTLDVIYSDYYDGFDQGLRSLHNVDRLEKLESFRCYLYLKDSEPPHHMLRNLTLPQSLKELRIDRLHWDDVTSKIGSLPLLEVLKLRWCEGHAWELVEGRFAKLKFLVLKYCCSLRYFTANNHYFPCLQRLLFMWMHSLEGISSEIGDMTTLKSIELYRCPDSAVVSAKEIAVEQYDNGNEELQVSATLGQKSGLSESFSECSFHAKPYRLSSIKL